MQNNMLTIERDKLYKLRNGDIVRVLATDIEGENPIAVVYVASAFCPVGTVSKRDALGRYPRHRYSILGASRGLDIVAEHREPRTLYANIYPWGVGPLHKSEHAARFFAKSEALEIAVPFREVIE